ncbi:hypothetical protein [Glycomyces sp. NPDC021274]|uniref:hypothetical protein n=1 Tax=Glycomyces sp. NPDC021274 TaxID=3155120 RepID=UPI0033C7D091
MSEPEPPTDVLATLQAAEAAFQSAREQLRQAEAERYRSIWQTLTAAEDMAELRAALPATITATSLCAAVRRHATEDTRYVQPELPDLDDGVEL